MGLLEKEAQVSLNVKIPKSVDVRLKNARQVARNEGLKFNVSESVTEHLKKELKKVEKSLGITPQDIDNLDLFKD
jgi:hypothetical protein